MPASPLLSTAPPGTAEPAVAAGARGLVKVYGSGQTAVRALDGVDVDMEAGRLTAIMGPSGSGKSTLMHCLAGLDTITAGRVHIGDTELGGLSDRALTRMRRDRVGFVFQSFNLLPTLTAEQNVRLPVELAGRRLDQDWYEQIIDVLGLADRMSHRPASCPAGSSNG